MRTCAVCGVSIAHRAGQARHCSKECARVTECQRHDARYGLSGVVFPPRLNGGCVTCGVTLKDRPRQVRYCSKACRRPVNALRDKLRYDTRRESIECASPLCNESFIPRAGSISCSPTCKKVTTSYRNIRFGGIGPAVTMAISLGQITACRVYFIPCPDCDEFVCTRAPNGTLAVCKTCRIIRNSRINARKNHERRALGKLLISVHDIADRDGSRCHICRRKVNIQLPGNVKWGPTIEHILPVSKGGTNDVDNLALAHWYCNTSRGNRGSSQLLLSV